ncbi:2-oxoglutarate dehydrogenase E1 component [Acuticoccus yangtzensis]|uniref:2-oxoglutarate dehydrogenase E1 component n=1 Tax=Acuticoccus yangtzensis TaxID=1443441 RepID=UPI000949619C|nr:2-oxoglutarate dehydrogenase E1 component [Acuticoccus yangtzensis]
MARQDANAAFLNTSFLDGANAAYLEQLYARYQVDPTSVDAGWQAFFAGMQDDSHAVEVQAKGPRWAREDWPVPMNGELVSALDGNWGEIETRVKEKVAEKAQKSGQPVSEGDLRRAARDSVRAIMMIRAYRMRGHYHAQLDPLGIAGMTDEELSPRAYGFEGPDLDRPIFLDNVLGLEFATVRQMLAILERTYCQTMGVEFMHISDGYEKGWIQERIEGPDKAIAFTVEGRKAILNKLVEAEGFEKFLGVKYTGTKRFGLDGGEAVIPALEQIIKRGGNLGIRDIAVGMAHRGRLNVLAQVMGKPLRAIFHEFKGGSFKPDEVEGSGDVKYHLGASSDREFDGNSVHLSLTANPSHLEIVDPVVLGKVRAKQDQFGDTDRSQAMALLLHGDAAFAGQGVVAECFGLSGLKGHRTGGSIHVIINNQIGFTTNPHFSRSSPYPSDVAKMIEAPIFHVNGDDPEAVVFAAKVATEFRQKFHKPVVIDMFCYRRFGHNEGDEPAFTQPIMYKKIRQHPTTLEIYGKRLVDEGVVSNDEVEKMKSDWREHLDAEFEAGQSFLPNKADWLDGRWKSIKPGQDADDPRRGHTGVEMDELKSVGEKLTTVPEGFHVHRTVGRFMDARRKAIETGEGIDWATAEALAFGTLLKEGYPVRLSGQDCERGTFSQRHSVLYDQESEERFIPLNNLAPEGEQKRYEVINSMLSEEAVLGFEYGYSLAEPDCLTLWEAQFGDFANGAQVVFDQFISSGERKWLRMTGLVCLLPHGYEGQGPEHSSARLERFLQLCAEDNMQVANCSTPANYFHILRRQLKREVRKPLILMTPKSLLRHKRCVSTLDEMGPDSTFHRVLLDDAQMGRTGDFKLAKDEDIRRVVLCSGKVYYDLLEERESRECDDVYLLRVEQLYPFPAKSIVNELKRFPNADLVWCQEEPANMGSWTFVSPYLDWCLTQVKMASQRPRYIGRPAAASPATGLAKRHTQQLDAFLEQIYGEGSK